MNNNLNKPSTNTEDLKPTYMMQEDPHWVYLYWKIIVLYDETWTYNLTNWWEAPSSKTLLEDWDKIPFEDLDEKIKEKIIKVKETHLWKIYTKDQITLMLYPDILDSKFFTSVNESEFSELEKENIKKAVSIMKSAHKNQFRDEWLPYYVHPLKVSFDIFKNWWSYEEIVCWLLHDVIEDNDNTDTKKLTDTFWENIINNVILLSKKDKIWKINQEDYMRNIEKSKIAIDVKWHDRINNIASTYFLNNDKRIRYIDETENIYVPFFEKHNPEIARKLKEILKYIKINPQPTEKELQLIKQAHDSYVLINKIKE